MPGLNYKVTVPPTVEPVSLSLAKKQLRVDIPDDNYLIQTYIEIARDYCERECNRAFYTQTMQLFLDSFPYGDYRSTVPMDQRSPWNYSAYWSDLAIRLPKPMTLSVDSIAYVDSSGTPQTLDPSAYYVDVNSRPGRIVPAMGLTWPITQFYQPGSIMVQYKAGSYVTTITETIPVATVAPFVGILTHQVVSITSVKDTGGNTLAATPSLVLDQNGDPTSQTQLTFSAAPPSHEAVITYQAGIIPKSIIAAMLLVIGHLYEHREENTELNLKTLPLGVKNFLGKHIFNNFGDYRSGY